MSQPQLIITQKKSKLWYTGWVFGVLILLAASYAAGRFYATYTEKEALHRAELLQAELDKFKTAYQNANQELIMQTQTAQVDNQSNQQLVETVKKMQATQLSLESELAFYRKIMAPELEQDGLTIAEFEVSKSAENSSSKFKLVLTQAGKQEQFLKGEVTLELHGKEAGKDKVYKFSELGTFQAKDFQFQFRYFQNIEGELNIPETFSAEQVVIQAATRGLRKNQTAQKQFNWNI